MDQRLLHAISCSWLSLHLLPYLWVLVVQQVDEVGHCRGLLDHEAARRRVRAHQVENVDNLEKIPPVLITIQLHFFSKFKAIKAML